MSRRLMLTAAVAVVVAVAGNAAERPVELFNGRDFAGWTFFLEHKGANAEGKGRIGDFAAVKPGGIVEIDSKMHGALMTERDFLNYDLHVEYRWADPKPNDDSGIFLRIRPPFVWDAEHGELARFYMLQIEPGNTGDLWVMGYSEAMLKTAAERSFKPFGTLELGTPGDGRGGHIRRHLKARDSERALGEWNALDVLLDGKTIKVVVNGELVNEATGIVDLPGRIGLESERGKIQFRNIHLKPRPDRVSDK